MPVAIVASAGGTFVLKLADDSTIAVPVEVGPSILPFVIKTVVSAGTTATPSYASLT